MLEENDSMTVVKGNDASVFTRLARTEERMKNMDRRVQIVEEQNKSLSKVANAMEMMQRLEEERQKRQLIIDQQQQLQTERLSATLERLNGSFNNMSDGMLQLNNKLDNVENDVAGVKIEVGRVNDKVTEIEADNSINWKKGLKKIGGTSVVVIVTVVVTWILTQLGISK